MVKLMQPCVHIHSTAKYTLLEASTSGLRQNFPPFHMGYVTKIKTSGAFDNFKNEMVQNNHSKKK